MFDTKFQATLASFALLILCGFSTGAESAERPNFIVIIGDDISWNDYGAYGHPHIRTPHVDQLAKNGMRFDLAFLTTSSCSPSRCSIMTGRYPHATGAGELHQPLPEDQITFAKLLKEDGYYTAAAGKWHLGNAPRDHFDVIKGGGPSGCEQWVPTLQGRDQGKPFFMWFAAVDAHRGWSREAVDPPHTNQDVIVPPYMPDTEDVRKDLALYYDEVSRMDEYVGKVVAELKSQKVFDNTVIIVMADNGRPFPRCKTTMYDSGIRTPFVVSWPQEVDAGEVNRNLVSSVDIAPTFLQLAGLEPPESFQGKSFANGLRNSAAVSRDYIFAEHNWHDYAAHDRAVRDGRYLYIRNSFPEFPATPPADAVRSLSYDSMQALEAAGKLPEHQRQCFLYPRAAEELYDLEADPHSLKNIAEDPRLADVKARLSKALDQWIVSTDDAIPTPLTPDKFHRRLGNPLPGSRAIQDRSGLPALPTIGHKIPPQGVEIDAAVLESLRKRLKALKIALELPQARGALSADVSALVKSVQWAVDLGEFYSPTHADIAKAVLTEAERRVALLAAGENDWTRSMGLVVRGYYSSIDGSAQPYGLEIPEDFDFQKPAPLYVWLHGRGDKTTDMHFIHQRMNRNSQIAPQGAIVVHPFGRHCMGFKSAGEIDILECVAHVRSQYQIDPQRIVLMGFSMGGAGAWHVGAHYADHWVAVGPGAGFAETKEYNKMKPENYPANYVQTLWGMYDVPNYVRNLFNMPVIAYSGELDKQIQAAQVMERAFLGEGAKLPHVIGPGMGHRYHPDSLASILQQIDEAVQAGKPEIPKKVHLQTQTLRYNRMYWLTVTGLEKHWQDSRVDAEMKDPQTYQLSTKNITTLSLDPALSLNGATIKVDGQTVQIPPTKALQVSEAVHLVKEGGADGNWKRTTTEPTGLVKRPGLQGPIDDAFLSSFLLVLPSKKSRNPEVERWVHFEIQHFLHRWKTLYRGTPKMKWDKDVSQDDVRENNLIVFGDIQSNTLLQLIMQKQKTLPIQWTNDQLTVNGKQYDAASHVPVMIYPNPLYGERYVVLNSGPTHREGHDRTNSLQNPKLPDWAVIDLATPPTDQVPGGIVDTGFFDESWK
ncbi:MAG: hypothetical protein CMJ79_15215 [Planctomycetaceae bacterium]|nr:hypothetical protein [Planctomycetaceae bacterium]MBK97043.1 hypothetical protein [Planctomycetaceae bacterium]|tara:strand:+ start:8229 stop:11540 length:3312 start_codon:yes stop_codon:yes gene_type:complete